MIGFMDGTMSSFFNKVAKRVLMAAFALILVGGVAHAVSIDAFNKTEHSAHGADGSQTTYLEFNDRADSTSSWLKRDYDLYGKTVDLKAQTVDGTFVNDSDDTVASWEATINIGEDCFINNAWVGTVEIHQFVGTDNEATQTLNLRDYDLEEVKLAYLYDGDLLIPLAKGDYIVYHPSEADELEVKPHGELTMGMILYFLDHFDISDYSVIYYYHRDFTHGAGFVALAVLAILWVMLLMATAVAYVAFKRAVREAELKKTGLASMSSIYSILSFIDIQDDVLTPVYADEKTQEKLPQGPGAKEKLRNIFERDTAAAYRSAVLEFIDTDTLPERLENGSIALEYVSKTYGWSKIRFFAVDSGEGEPIERVLLTIQDINSEKREQERVEKHTARIELESSAKGAFVEDVSRGMKSSTLAINALADRILDESDDEPIRSCASQIKRRSRLLTYLIDDAVDLSSLDSGDIRATSKGYSFAEVVTDACAIAEMIAEDGRPRLEVEIAPSIPESLVGDARRIERALIDVLAYIIHLDCAEAVKISAYGAQREESMHVLVSIKANGSNIGEKEASEFSNFIAKAESGDAHHISDDIKELEGIALTLLLMGAKLQMVNEPGESLELYFELEQDIARDASASGDDDGA